MVGVGSSELPSTMSIQCPGFRAVGSGPSLPWPLPGPVVTRAARPIRRSGPNQGLVEQNIKASIDAFEDENHDDRDDGTGHH
jgi:hypothetical protein